MLPDIPRPRLPIRFVATLAAAALFASPGDAALLSGPFQVCPSPALTVGTDGTTFFVSNGNEYPVPAALQPTADFSFSVPTGSLLQAVAAQPDLSCEDGTQLWLYEMPNTSGAPLVPIRTGLCLPNGRASECHYSGLSAASPQSISSYVQFRADTVVTQQLITWVDLETGASSNTVLSHQAAGGPALQWAPSGNAAFIQHDLPTQSDWILVDTCPGSLGSVLANFEDLGAGAKASVVQTSPGVYVARVSHPSLPGGATDVPLVDCLETAPPPPDTARLEVQLTGDGEGRVQDLIGLIACDSTGNPNRCLVDVAEGTMVFLTAGARPGSSFLGWSGDCAGVGTAVLTMDSDKVCVADFDAVFADLQVSASAPSPATAGGAFTWTVDVTNAGPDAAPATLSAALPADVAFDAQASSATCTPAGQQISCSVGTLAAAAGSTITLTGDVAPTARGTLSATFSVAGPVNDPVSANDQQTVQTPIDVRVDVSLSKSAATQASTPGGLAVWQLEVCNAGPASALAPSVLDMLPAGASPVADPALGQVACTSPNLGPGACQLYTLMTRIDAGASPGTVLVNSADVTSSELDSDTSNDQDTAQVDVVAPPAPPAPGTVRRIALAGEQPAGASQPFDRFQEPAVEGELVAFSTIYPDGFGGVFLAAGDDEPVEVVARDRQAPDGAGLLRGGYAPSLDGGLLASSALLDGVGAHFYVTDACGPRRLGGLDAGVFEGTAAGGEAVYLVTLDVGGTHVMHWDGTATQSLVSQGDPIPGSAELFSFFSVRPAFDGQTAAFRGVGPGFPPIADGIYAWDAAGGLRVLADLSTLIPGRAEPFVRFADNLDVGGGAVVFIGVDAAGDEGLYRADLATGGLEVVADATTPVTGPGGVPVTLTRFSVNFPSIAGDEVAFVATESGGTGLGLYIRGGSGVRLALAGGEPLGDGFQVGGLVFGPQGFDGERLAFRNLGFMPPATLAEGIYVLELGQVEIFADGFESGDSSAWSSTLP